MFEQSIYAGEDWLVFEPNDLSMARALKEDIFNIYVKNSIFYFYLVFLVRK